MNSQLDFAISILWNNTMSAGAIARHLGIPRGRVAQRVVRLREMGVDMRNGHLTSQEKLNRIGIAQSPNIR